MQDGGVVSPEAGPDLVDRRVGELGREMKRALSRPGDTSGSRVGQELAGGELVERRGGALDLLERERTTAGGARGGGVDLVEDAARELEVDRTTREGMV